MTNHQEPLDKVLQNIKDRWNLTPDKIESINFIFWLTCHCELTLKYTIKYLYLHKLKLVDNAKNLESFLFYPLDEMHLLGLSSIFKKNIDELTKNLPETIQVSDIKKGFKKILAYINELNRLRNNIAHYRFEKLEWKHDSIFNKETQFNMIDQWNNILTEIPKDVLVDNTKHK